MNSPLSTQDVPVDASLEGCQTILAAVAFLAQRGDVDRLSRRSEVPKAVLVVLTCYRAEIQVGSSGSDTVLRVIFYLEVVQGVAGAPCAPTGEARLPAVLSPALAVVPSRLLH